MRQHTQYNDNMNQSYNNTRKLEDKPLIQRLESTIE